MKGVPKLTREDKQAFFEVATALENCGAPLDGILIPGVRGEELKKVKMDAYVQNGLCYFENGLYKLAPVGYTALETVGRRMEVSSSKNDRYIR